MRNEAKSLLQIPGLTLYGITDLARFFAWRTPAHADSPGTPHTQSPRLWAIAAFSPERQFALNHRAVRRCRARIPAIGLNYNTVEEVHRLLKLNEITACPGAREHQVRFEHHIT